MTKEDFPQHDTISNGYDDGYNNHNSNGHTNDGVDNGIVEDIEDYDDKKKEREEFSSSDSAASGNAKPTLFSDEEGNLKFVKLVVRYPCCIFCTQIFLLIVICFLLIIAMAQSGQPFSDPDNEADLDDVRSIQYDSLRLAQEEVEETRLNRNGGDLIRRQSELKDYTYWIWEAETEAGVFGTRTSIAAMKEAFDLFLEDEQWDQYCFLQYPNPNDSTDGGNGTEPYCDKPLTSLSMYYAAQWNATLVDSVMTQLKVPGNIELFNELVLCYTQGIFCNLIQDEDSVSQDDIDWALALNNDLQEITRHWDMSGPLVDDIDQATEFAAYVKLVDAYKGKVDFGYDKNFGVDNLVSRYSRGIVLWGGPLETTEALTTDEREDQDEEDSDARREYVA